MDDEGGELLSDYEQIDEKSVVMIQALIRGALVRKCIREVKEAYVQVLSDIEKKQNVCVEWDKPVSLPKVFKRRHNTNKLRSVKDKTNKQQQIEMDLKSSSKSFGQTETESVISSADDNQLESNLRIPQLSTVETQTSFIVLNNDHRPDENSRDVHKELPVHIQSASIENNFTDYDRTLNKSRLDKIMNLSHGDELGSVHTESLKSDSLKLDNEKLYANKQLPLHIGNLPNFEATRDLSEEDIQSLSSSHRSSYTDEGKSTEAFQVKPHHDNMTKIEAIDSARSEGSEISDKSAKTRKERLTSGCDKENFGDEPSNENISSSKDLDGLSLSNFHERPSPACSPYSNRCEDGVDIDQGRNKSPLSDRSETSVKSYRSNGSHRSDRSQKSNKSLKSARSHKSDRGQFSDRSKRSDIVVESNRGLDSDRSQKSDKTNKSGRSHVSDRSRKSEDSHRSQRCRTAHSPREERHYDLKSPRPSSMSPVPMSRKVEDLHHGTQPRISNQDSTTLTNVTSVWDSYNSFRESHDFEMPESLPDDTDKLKELRKNISMELLWVQQAINSRKNYLKLKNKM